MLWLIQHMKKEATFDSMIEIFDKVGIEYKLVKALAFADKIVAHDTVLNGQDVDHIPEIQITSDQPIFVCGSYSLARIAKQKGWQGAFLNDNFDYISWKKGWGAENLLSNNAIVENIEDIVVPENWSKFFARPLHDTKSFSGTIFERENFFYWRDQLLKAEAESLNGKTPIIVSDLKEIYIEYRFFVVDRRIVTGSVYKRGNQVIYDDLISSDVLGFAQSMIEIWQPDRAFVLDVAATPNGFKIIEVNNINSSGFYACSLHKFIDAIENMEF